jgi:sensor domain CHASE-containing protein
LITEFESGRVFIVNPKGKVVYEYVNKRSGSGSEAKYYEITKAELIPKDFFTQPLKCQQAKATEKK